MIYPDSVDLNRLYIHLTDLATEAGLLVLPGIVTIDEELHPFWRWSGDHGTEGEMVEFAKQAGTRLVYAHRSELDLDSLIRLELEEAYLNDEEEEPDTYAQLKSSLRNWWPKDGQTYAVSFSFFHQGVGHILFVSVAWIEELGSDMAHHLVDLKERSTIAYKDLVSKERAERRSQADTLARDGRYGRAKNEPQRQIVAEEMFPAFDYVEIRDLLALAKAIFQDEVAPEIERRLAEQAKALHDEGDTIAQISVKTGISKERVQRLLYLANKEG